MYKIGIDLGGTKIEGVLLDDSLDVLKRKRVPTPKGSYDGILDAINSLTGYLSEDTDDCSIGICMPGAISNETGLVKNSNTLCLTGKPLKQDLEKRIGDKVALENDANCFAVAEATLGSARDFELVFGVIMGTGVGGGITINGKIHCGRSKIAGEWGHHTLHPHGIACYCGRSGCAETYLSGPALERRWFDLTGRHESMSQIVQDLDSQIGRQFKRDWLEDFGLGIANVIDILDPDVIVLGGGLSNVDFLYTEGKRSIYEKVFSDFVDTPILRNSLGDSAGVFGAALLD